MTSTTSLRTTEPKFILKTDKLGRVQVPREQREAILDEFERTGMTGAAFARHYGIKYQTFAWWRKDRRQKRAAQRPGSVAFAEVVVADAQERPAPSGLGVELPGGGRVVVRDAGDAELAAALLRALERPGAPEAHKC